MPPKSTNTPGSTRTLRSQFRREGTSSERRSTTPTPLQVNPPVLTNDLESSPELVEAREVSPELVPEQGDSSSSSSSSEPSEDMDRDPGPVPDPFIPGRDREPVGEPLLPEIDPMMLPRGLPIVVPQGLREISVPHHLPKFSGSRDDDPAAHVERFEEILISNLVTDPGYYLIWFPNTLTGTAYSWYRSHDAGTFLTWRQLQAAFLRYFRPETGQQQALSALTSIRRGSTEDLTSYIRRFQMVCTRYVGGLLNDSTIRHYFIQGVDSAATIREILSRRPVTLNDAIQAALDIEIIDKENERMVRRMDDPIPAFIPVHHQGTSPTTYRSSSPKNLTPLATQEPMLALTAPVDQLRTEMRQVSSEMTRAVQALTEQMACLVKGQNQQVPPKFHESGSHSTGVWCNHCGQPNHTPQFCPLLKDNPPPPRPRGPAQPYRHPNSQNQVRSNSYDRPVCPTCKKPHGPGNCWVENNIICERCGEHHPTVRCSTLDKVIPLEFPRADYAKQAQDNQRGVRFSEPRNTNGPPNMYYDYANNRQTQNAPDAIQTNQGVTPVVPNQGTQDARFLSLDVPESSRINEIQTSLFVGVEVSDLETMQKSLPALVVTRGGAKTGLPPPVEEEEVDSPDSSSHSSMQLLSSPDSPQFSDLQSTLKETAKQVRFNEHLPSQTEMDENEYQFVQAGTPFHPPDLRVRTKTRKGVNPSSPYNLWEDLADTKANISFGQLVKIAPSLRRQLKEGATVPRGSRIIGQVNQVEPMNDLKDIKSNLEQPKTLLQKIKPDLRDSKEIFEPVEIDVEILDKVIPKALVDDGSGVNIMPAFTMRKLGLEITHPSYVTLKCADQRSVKTLGRIKDLRIQTEGVDYIMTFEVLQFDEEANGAYPLLLGRGFLRQCGGVVNWAEKKPTFTYGPKNARTMVAIVSKNSRAEINPEQELPTFQAIRVEPTTDLGPIRCIGPGLYDYVDDGSFEQWLREYPYSGDESYVIIDVPGSPIVKGDTSETPIELSDDTENDEFQSTSEGSSQNTTLGQNIGECDVQSPTESVVINRSPEPIQPPPTAMELAEVKIIPSIANPIPIWPHGSRPRSTCSRCITPSETRRCLTDKPLSLPIDCNQPKDWDLSLTLTLGQPTSSDRGKKVLRETKTSPTFAPHPFASTNPPIDRPITIKDLSGSFHPPTEWNQDSEKQKGNENIIPHEEDTVLMLSSAWTVPIEVIPYGIRNVPGSLRNRITEVEDPEEKDVEVEPKDSQAQVKSLSIKDLRITTTTAFNTLYQWYLCL